jgi:Bifunctional DNA primase/polymerase, N-terminal
VTGSTRTDATVTHLSVPALPDGIDTIGAGMLYAKAGFYILPGHRAQVRNPGRIVGKGWQHKSSRDPDTIAALFAGTNNVILIHCGRSDVLAFDVDHPEHLPDILAPHLPSAPFQETRPDTQPDRGHALFGMPAGRTIGNSTGRLGRQWGEVRGLNGVILVAPVGTRRWLRTGVVPQLPDQIAELLDDASPATDAATDATVTTFITEHTDATWPALLRGWTNALQTHLETGSRHNGLVSVLTGALKEARAGFFSAGDVDIITRAMFVAAATRAPTGGERQRTYRQANAEYESIRSWAVAQANAADLAAVRRRVEDKYVSAI